MQVQNKVLYLANKKMKTLIIYSGKYGTTKLCAEKLGTLLNESVQIASIQEVKDSDLSACDRIIIGSSVYAGAISKKLKKFCVTHEELLKMKSVCIFICSGTEATYSQNNMNRWFPTLNEYALVKGYFGGVFDFSKMNAIERFIIKQMSKKNLGPEPKILEENIEIFARNFQEKTNSSI